MQYDAPKPSNATPSNTNPGSHNNPSGAATPSAAPALPPGHPPTGDHRGHKHD